MGHLKENIMKKLKEKPIVYCGYVDDIFVITKDKEQAEQIKVQLEKHSVLKFTIECNKYSELPFRDVIVNNSEVKFKLKVHHNQTSEDTCLNGKSKCPDRYKKVSYQIMFEEPIKSVVIRMNLILK